MVDNACLALSRIAEAFAHRPDSLNMLCEFGLISNAVQLVCTTFVCCDALLSRPISFDLSLQYIENPASQCMLYDWKALVGWLQCFMHDIVSNCASTTLLLLSGQ